LEPPEYFQEEPPRKRRGIAGVIVAAIAVIIVILLMASPWFWALLGGLTSPVARYDEGAKISVTRTISFTVQGSGAIDYVVDVPLPRNLDRPSGGYVQESTKTDPDPLPLDEYKYGQHWMVWDGFDSSGKTITIDYDFTVETVVWDISSDESADVDAIPADVVEAQTGDEWKINPGEPGIAALANDLTRLEGNVRDKLRAIYDYLEANIVYETGRDGLPKYCTDTLRDGTGDCDDQSILYCSIARAAGIPAWMEFGALYDSGRDVWGGHAWVKAYVPLVSGGGGAVCIDVVNKEFFIRPCNRFSDWESDGNGTHIEDYYSTLSYSSAHQVNVDYSESYEGAYEPTGGKVSPPKAIISPSTIDARVEASRSSRRVRPQIHL
jgi:hypothetical protein